jgi:hypothetical protein
MRLGALNKVSLDSLHIVQRLEQVFPIGKGLEVVKRVGIEQREPPLDVIGQRGRLFYVDGPVIPARNPISTSRAGNGCEYRCGRRLTNPASRL